MYTHIHTCTTTAVGTPGYIAPESYESFVYMNKSDVWALGVIRYVCMCVCVGVPIALIVSNQNNY